MALLEVHEKDVDGFEILENIGEGSNGVVYKGGSKDNGQFVALKKIRAQQCKETTRIVSAILNEK